MASRQAVIIGPSHHKTAAFGKFFQEFFVILSTLNPDKPMKAPIHAMALLMLAATTIAFSACTPRKQSNEPTPVKDTDRIAVPDTTGSSAPGIFKTPPSTTTESPQPTSSSSLRNSIDVSEYYDEGYKKGYDDGMEDGMEGNEYSDYYDDSNNYSGSAADDFVSGYSDGYDAGYYDNKTN